MTRWLLSLSVTLAAVPVVAIAACPDFTPIPGYLAGSGPSAIAMSDFNKDGKLDLAIANQESSDITILLGTGNSDGSFARLGSIPTGTGPAALAIGDFNGDNNPDLATANQSGNNVTILLGNGNGSFQSPVAYSVGGTPYDFLAGDFNGDGKLDLIVSTTDIAVLIGNGDGTFGSATHLSISGGRLAAADFNGDGKLDLAVATPELSIFLGNGDGTFQAGIDTTTTAAPIAVADFNGDTKPDLAIGSSGSLKVLLGAGNGTFTFAGTVGVTGVLGRMAAGDFDGDGTPDVAEAYANSSAVTVSLVNPDGTFENPISYGANHQPAGVVIGDFSGDGKNDFAVANRSTGDVYIYLNACTPPDLTITKVHYNDEFTRGDTGDLYFITVNNNGSGPTRGLVTVTDTLPAGLTATGMGGGGWTCNLDTLTCTSRDRIPSGGSFPRIALTVNVADSFPPAETINTVAVSGGGEVNVSNDTATDTVQLRTKFMAAPANFVATAVSSTQVLLTWDPVPGATDYEVFSRVNGSPYSPSGITTATSLIDNSVSINSARVYNVRARDVGGNRGPSSNFDIATTVMFTDDPISIGSTVIQATHVSELRTAVNAVRTAAGLRTSTFSTPMAPGVLIRAQHILELRAALDFARAVLGLPPIHYTDPSLTAGTIEQAAHIEELRSGVK
jgi:uncharacterized repeat protein (TIGR01451 family)